MFTFRIAHVSAYLRLPGRMNQKKRAEDQSIVGINDNCFSLLFLSLSHARALGQRANNRTGVVFACARRRSASNAATHFRLITVVRLAPDVYRSRSEADELPFVVDGLDAPDRNQLVARRSQNVYAIRRVSPSNLCRQQSHPRAQT